ncbi:hypothetical protein LMH87_005634 [Akanthomyces muscarius]|uniref:Uncharacterized protein n=1 Tax=Akanthomyces muscarius TaxID=2231603 RepID=A0A9W8QPK4_AKAMU|nr:hypothetical protein LMH87_005634 [Akanthomyces muscarius]KAJ4163937.1 hypothetical protein LMH87_005634 [Akanthomyces muscarius]
MLYNPTSLLYIYTTNTHICIATCICTLPTMTSPPPASSLGMHLHPSSPRLIHVKRAPGPLLLTQVPAPTAIPTTHPSVLQSQVRVPTPASRASGAQHSRCPRFHRHRPRQNAAATTESPRGGRRRHWPAYSPTTAAPRMRKRSLRKRLPVRRTRPLRLLVSRHVEQPSTKEPRWSGEERMAGSRNKGVTRREDERGIEQGRPGGSARVLPTLSQSRRIDGASCHFTTCTCHRGGGV